jgi:acetyl-CoA acetyltransferase
MTAHPFSEVAIAGTWNTRQARVLDGHDTLSISLEAARGVLADTGVAPAEVDAIYGSKAPDLAYLLGIGPVWTGTATGGISAVLEAASLIAAGQCRTVLIADGGAGIYTQRDSTAPWTRPSNEFVAPFGMYTAVEFALIARHHMDRYGTTPEQLAHVAATIRNNGHVNPGAVYFGRGPFTPADVLASRMVADPFHLLDCSMTAEGGSALLLTRADRAADLAHRPAYVLGGGVDLLGPAYQHPPRWDLTAPAQADLPNGYIGRRAARQSFATAGLGPADVDCCELYDPFSFEIIRQYEAFEFCGPGEGGAFVAGSIGPGQRYPTTTDGGLLSFGHGGNMVQMLQRVVRAVEQVQGRCASMQVPDARVALCSNGGAGALFCQVMLVGADRP